MSLWLAEHIVGGVVLQADPDIWYEAMALLMAERAPA